MKRFLSWLPWFLFTVGLIGVSILAVVVNAQTTTPGDDILSIAGWIKKIITLILSKEYWGVLSAIAGFGMFLFTGLLKREWLQSYLPSWLKWDSWQWYKKALCIFILSFLAALAAEKLAGLALTAAIIKAIADALGITFTAMGIKGMTTARAENIATSKPTFP